MNLENALDELVKALAVTITSEARTLLLGFAALVEKWNARMDLTAAKRADQIAEVLFADALMLMREDVIPRGARVVDIGSGAGAPALPLLLLRDDLHATLVEPLHKRIAFMRTVSGTLSDLAKRATILEGKIDTAEPKVKGMPFDVAMARATFAPEIWLPAGKRLGKRVLVLTAEAQALGETPLTHVDYVLPRTNATRVIGVYE